VTQPDGLSLRDYPRVPLKTFDCFSNMPLKRAESVCIVILAPSLSTWALGACEAL
jgi:hypothetical protein